MALTGVTRYKDMNDYKQDYETLEEAQADFDEKLADGFIQNITLATFNDLHFGELYTILEETEENSENMTKWDYIRVYTALYNVFTIGGLVYVERD